MHRIELQACLNKSRGDLRETWYSGNIGITLMPGRALRLGPMIGGGGGGVTITGPIHVHGVQNAAQLLGELKREAARKNTRLVEAMS